MRGAAYLSRETLPFNYVGDNLSFEAQQLVKALLSINRKSSGMSKQIKTISKREYPSLMQEIINNLRAIADWNKKPNGIAGAEMLAELDPTSKSLLLSFLKSQPDKPWINQTIDRLSK